MSVNTSALGLQPGETIGGLRATVESQRRDIEYMRIERQAMLRELATFRHDPEVVPAPRFEGHVWMALNSWCGPYHLVGVTTQPYPKLIEGVKLPDIEVPAKKALCGAEWRTPAPWPQAPEVCAACVQRAVEKGVVVHAVPAPTSTQLHTGTRVRHKTTGVVASLISRKEKGQGQLPGWWIELSDGSRGNGLADIALDRDWEVISCSW